MDPIVQWGITSIIGILTFLGGRYFERHRQAQINRQKLLEPIEEWVGKASRLIGIVGDELSALSQGLPLPISYGPEDRIETAKSLGENKEKVLGILKSKALSTRGSKRISTKLFDLTLKLDQVIEREYLQAYYKLFDKITARQDPRIEMFAVLAITVQANSLIEDIHSCLSQLKTRLT